MSGFCERFPCSLEVSGESVLAALGYRTELGAPPPGLYGHGLLTLVDTVAAAGTALERWQQMIRQDARLLAFTGFGDYFYWSPDAGEVFFVDVQYAVEDAVTRDLEQFVNHFLVQEPILQSVLRSARFSSVRRAKGDLEYGQCHILEPWPMLGGKDIDEKYIAGSFAIYVDLVAQQHGW